MADGVNPVQRKSARPYAPTMKDDKIDIKLTSIPYPERKKDLLKWILLPYIFIIIVAGLSTDLNGMLLTTGFMFLLFIIDYLRRLRWVRYSLESLEADISGISLTYQDKDSKLSMTIPWKKLSVSKGFTFSHSPRKIISFRTEMTLIASFYATDNFNNDKIDDLYLKIKEIQQSNA